jgi:hypothetical protein
MGRISFQLRRKKLIHQINKNNPQEEEEETSEEEYIFREVEEEEEDMRSYVIHVVRKYHMSWDCPENVARQGNVQIAQDENEPRVLEDNVEVLEEGEDLLMRRTLLK